MKTLKRTDYWQSLMQDSQFLFSLLAVCLIGLMLTDFFFIFVFSTMFYMAYLEFQKRMSLYSTRKRRFIIAGIVTSTTAFITIFVYAISEFISTMNAIPEAANKGNLMSQVVAWLTPLKQTLTGIASFFLDNQDAIDFVDNKITETISKGAEFFVGFFLHTIASLPEILLILFIFLISLLIVGKYYKNTKFKTFMHTQSTVARERLKILFRFCELSAYDAVISTFVVAMTQGAIICAGALVAGIDLWPVYFVAAFAFSFVPVVGLLPIILVGGLHVYYVSGVSSLVIFGAFGATASTMDNVLRVLLLSQSNNAINPFISFFCLIGSISLFGLKGLILGPFLLSLAGYLLSAELPQHSLQTESET